MKTRINEIKVAITGYSGFITNKCHATNHVNHLHKKNKEYWFQLILLKVFSSHTSSRLSCISASKFHDVIAYQAHMKIEEIIYTRNTSENKYTLYDKIIVMVHAKNRFFLQNLSAQAHEGISNKKLTVPLRRTSNNAFQNEKFK